MEIRRLSGGVERWETGYDWRSHEKALNDALPMFTRDIDVDEFGTLNLHYVHARSTVANAIPLFYSHGCTSGPLNVGVVVYSPRVCVPRAWTVL